MKKLCVFCLFLGLYLTTQAEVRLPQLFQKGMVLQRGQLIPVWGWASPGEKVSVSLNRKTVVTQTDANGCWRVDLPPMKAGGPYIMEVKGGENEILTLGGILIGDVWLCSGQSNIDVTIERVYPQYTDEIDGFSSDKIRLFRVQNETDTHSLRDDIRPTDICWLPTNKENAWKFSAVGYFLGRRMLEKTGVPQGIIVNSWGGTPIEAWISADSLRQDFPLMVRETEYWDNATLREAYQKASAEADRQWFSVLNASDPGMPQFTQPGYDDSCWKPVSQWDHSWGKATGSIWLRKHINIDKEHAGKPARLLLGTLYDMDFTYVNGQQVGVTYYQYPPRRYDLPEGLLREGDNVITLRFVNKYGQAYFIPEKPYKLVFGPDRENQNPIPADTIGLGPEWLYHSGAEMPRQPGGGAAVQNLPTTLYNAVLYPLAPYALSGVVWYQGESNTGQPDIYGDLLKKMMGNWRALWQRPDMPFCIVQLANFLQPSEQPQPQSGWARLREQQRLTAKNDPHAELAVINDLGETVDIHPLRKREVAERIGLCFDRLVYGDKKVQLSPEWVDAKVESDGKRKIVLTFDQPLQPGEVFEFELCEYGDTTFKNAKAEAEGCQITIDTEGFKMPATIRYAWKDNPLRANVRSLTGLPLSSFEMKFLYW